MAKAPTTQDLDKAKRAFLPPVACCLGVIAIIHSPLAPKPYVPNSSIRLLETLAYFSAALTLLFYMLGPRERYVRTLLAWRYADCPEGLRKAWQSYLFSLNSAVRFVVYLGLALVGGAAIEVLSLWFLGLAPLAGYAWWLRVIGMVGLLSLPLYFMGRLSEVGQRRRLLRELQETSDFVAKDASAASTNADPTPVSIVGEARFRAGGFEWGAEDFYKNAIVFGQPGTGKTVCVLNSLLDGFLGSTTEPGASASVLILDPKGDFLDKIRGLCDRWGRGGDLLILDPVHPDESIRWNPLDSKDDELQLSMRFAAVMEALGQKNEKDSFFTDAARTFMRHAIRLARLTNGGRPPSMEDVQQIASSTSRLARRVSGLDIGSLTRDDDTTLDYFADQWVTMASETRSSIVATLSNMIDPFLLEPYRSVFCERSDATIASMLDGGKILYVHMPIADREAMSRMICTMIKLEYFREVLRRPNKRRPSLFFCDEFQCFFTVAKGIGDADFFERSRQSNHANIIATQNFPSLLKYADRPEPVDNLLGNCAIKVFLRNTDDKTNKYAAELFGKELQGVGGVSVSDNNMGRKKQAPGANISYQEGFKVRPEVFTELRVPARGVSDVAESVVHLASRDTVSRERLIWRVHPL
ncbi:MAG: type IV secretion system DNA-binding domain-containing protein [Tepidisphaera sp.]